MFLGVPSAEAPVFFAVVVIIVVLIQSPRVHRVGRDLLRRTPTGSTAAVACRRREGRRMSRAAVAERRVADVGSTVRVVLGRRSALMPIFAALAIFIALLVGAQLYFGNFVTPLNMSSLLLDNAYLLILAVGMTFVIVTGGIDLSVGSVLAFTGILCAKLLSEGYSPALVVPVTHPGGRGDRSGHRCARAVLRRAAVHRLARRAVPRPRAGLRGQPRLDPGRSLRRAVAADQALPASAGWYITPTGIIALLVVVVGAFVMLFTRFGRTVYAVGGNEQSARLMGLPVARTKVLVYVISGTCAGLAGLVFTAYTGAGYPLNGIGTELDIIAAVVIGGTLLTGGSGYVLGSMIGVFVYGTIKTVISFLGAEQSWTRITIGLLLLVFVVVQRVIVVRSERRR